MKIVKDQQLSIEHTHLFLIKPRQHRPEPGSAALRHRDDREIGRPGAITKGVLPAETKRPAAPGIRQCSSQSIQCQATQAIHLILPYKYSRSACKRTAGMTVICKVEGQ